jgi:hypothetical protein
VTGALELHTVEACAAECQQGDRFSSGYVVVNETDLARIAAIHPVADINVAAVLLMAKAEALHQGERELFAHALALPRNASWLVCSPDLASVKFAVAAGIGERLVSLEEAVNAAGARPRIPLRNHFTSVWLSTERTKAILGIR